LFFGNGLMLRLGHQLAEFAANENSGLVSTFLGVSLLVSFQGLVREVQPLILFLHAQGAATGVDADHLAVGADGREIQLHIGVEPPFQAKVLGQPLRQAFEGKLLEVVAQTSGRASDADLHRTGWRPGHPAMGAKVDFAVGQTLQSGRVLQLPVLPTGLKYRRWPDDRASCPCPDCRPAQAPVSAAALAGRGLSFWRLISPWPLTVSAPNAVSPA
jgi:hypothetical protein